MQLEHFPVEILCNVINRLAYIDVISLSGVNMYIQVLCKDDTIWKLLVNKVILHIQSSNLLGITHSNISQQWL